MINTPNILNENLINKNKLHDFKTLDFIINNTDKLHDLDGN